MAGFICKVLVFQYGWDYSDSRDWWHYSEKVRKEKYDLDEAAIKPYLSLDNVIQGVFNTTNKLWGLNFREIYDIDQNFNNIIMFSLCITK